MQSLTILVLFILILLVVDNYGQETKITTTTVLRDTAKELEDLFTIAFVAIPICLIDICICLPIGKSSHSTYNYIFIMMLTRNNFNLYI